MQIYKAHIAPLGGAIWACRSAHLPLTTDFKKLKIGPQMFVGKPGTSNATDQLLLEMNSGGGAVLSLDYV